MSLKDQFKKEKDAIVNNKKPYESAAFIIFSILMLQQLFFLFRSIIKFMDKANNFFVIGNTTVINNNQGFYSRIINLDSSSWFYVLLGILASVLYYFLVYLFVWNYCRKRGYAKWTWTLIVVFGPTVLLTPAYVWYVLYVFRPYIFRFLKRGIEEFKAFNPEENLEPAEEEIIDTDEY